MKKKKLLRKLDKTRTSLDVWKEVASELFFILQMKSTKLSSTSIRKIKELKRILHA